MMSPKIEIQLAVAAPPTRVFDALTRASELEAWFAEGAHVSESERSYDFWGRFTPGAPSLESGRHRLRALTRPTALGFDWHLRGVETHVDIALDRTDEGTLLKLSHDAPPRNQTELSLTDFWLLSFENLRRFLEDGAAPVRCDYSLAPKGGVELDLSIAAAPGEVFRALTRPESIDRWMNASSALEPVVGGHVSFGWKGEGPVRVLEIVPDEKLSYSWHHGDDPETIVSWTLEDGKGRTRLTLVHSGFGPRDTEDFRTGWLKHVLWMKGILERGAAWTAPSVLGVGCDA
jgi:uncharacterized protein YndB with AHSA1/START domain